MSNIIKSSRVVEDSSRINHVSDGNKLTVAGLEDSTYDSKADLDQLLKETENRARQIIIEAEMEAKEIIRKSEESIRISQLQSEIEIKNNLKKYEEDSLLIKEEAKKIGREEGYSEGYKLGYEEAYASGEKASQEIIEESLTIKERYLKEEKLILKNLEPEIIKLIITIYEKILGQKINEDEEVIVELVASGIKNLDPTEKLIIISSKEDYEILEKYKDRILAEASLINELEIKYDINLEKGDCILETPKGNVDLSIKEQMEEVKMLLNKILNNE